MADRDYIRTVPVGSREAVIIALTDDAGGIPDLGDATKVEIQAKRDSEPGSETFNAAADGADDTPGSPIVSIEGDPTLGVVRFDPPSGWRDTVYDRIAYTVRVYSTADLYDTYPPERPIVELVRADDGR